MMRVVSGMRREELIKDGGEEKGERASVSRSKREEEEEEEVVYAEADAARCIPTDATIIWGACPTRLAGHPGAWLGDSS